MTEWIDADPQTLVSGLDAVKVLLIRCLGAVIACALQVALARLLGAVEYGMFALVWIWVIMLGQISPLGFSTVICRYAPFYSARGETALLRGFLSTTCVVVFALALAVTVVGIVGLWTLDTGLSDAGRWAFTAGLCIVPVIAMQDVVENIARAFNWPVLAIAPGYIVRPVLTLIGLFAILAASEIDAFAAICVTLAAALAAAAGQAAILLGRVRSAVRPGERIRRLGEWTRSALPLIFVDGTHLIFTNADILILSFYVGPEAIAVYYAASRILQLVAFGQYATTAATAQRFSALAANGDMAQLRSLAQHATWFNVVVSTAAAILVFWAAPFLLSMFGAGFESGAAVLTILVAGLILQAAAGPGEDILNMLGHQRACAATFVVSLALNIVLNLCLIPYFGLIGAALATTISVGARSFALSWVVRSRLGMNIVLAIPLGPRSESAT